MGPPIKWLNEMLKMKSAANVRQQIWLMNAGKNGLHKLHKKIRD
jgi:hypothetical protein